MIFVMKIKRPAIAPAIPDEGNNDSTIPNMRDTSKISRNVKRAFLNVRLSILNIFPQATHNNTVKIEVIANIKTKPARIANI